MRTLPLKFYLQKPLYCDRFLNKALLAPDSSKEDGKVCSVSDVEEAKSVLRLFPIWASCLVFAILIAQPPTFFTKQGVTMDRSFGSGFKVPAASLQCFISFSILLFVPIYDRILVPIARVLTRKPSGITMLQRIGTGMFLSIIAMVFAALVEVQRLKTAEQYGLVDMPNATIPMAVWWLIPQYVIFGVAQVFTMVGLQEFFYDEVPNELRSVGLSLYLSIFGVGSFLSSFLISVINKTTGGDGQTSWFNDNLNQAHLDYFYWLLAGLSTVGLSTYLYSARSYIYNSTSTTWMPFTFILCLFQFLWMYFISQSTCCWLNHSSVVFLSSIVMPQIPFQGRDGHFTKAQSGNDTNIHLVIEIYQLLNWCSE